MIKGNSKKKEANRAARQSRPIANSVARDIKLAEGLTTRASTYRGRLSAFRTMHLKVSNAVLHFREHIETVLVFDDPRRGPLLTFRFCGEEFVAALWALSAEAQVALKPEFATLPGREFTLRHAA